MSKSKEILFFVIKLIVFTLFAAPFYNYELLYVVLIPYAILFILNLSIIIINLSKKNFSKFKEVMYVLISLSDIIFLILFIGAVFRDFTSDNEDAVLFGMVEIIPAIVFFIFLIIDLKFLIKIFKYHTN